jgi:hypothetical protein
MQRAKFSKAPSVYAVLRDNAAARKAGTDICGDLIRGITDSLTPTEPEWSVAVLDETGKTLSRFRVVAETLFPTSVTKVESAGGPLFKSRSTFETCRRAP